MTGFSWLTLLRAAAREWLSDKGPRLSAALAFYSALSLGPLPVLALAAGGLFFSRSTLSGHLVDEMNSLIGSDGADVITTIIARSQEPSEGIIASLISLAVLLVGASGVFGELQDALNTIWNVPAKARQPFYHVITDRFLSFAMVLGTGFLLMISLVITTVLNVMAGYLDSAIALPYVMMAVNWAISIVVSTGLFALIFKSVPDIKIGWNDAWPGGLITALLFSLGKTLIGLYLGHSAIRTTYGAAGSFVVLLVWIYYSAQILYFGAEFTKVQVQAKASGRTG